MWRSQPLLHGEPQSLRASPCPAAGTFQYHHPVPCDTPTGPCMHSRAASAAPAAPAQCPARILQLKTPGGPPCPHTSRSINLVPAPWHRALPPLAQHTATHHQIPLLLPGRSPEPLPPLTQITQGGTRATPYPCTEPLHPQATQTLLSPPTSVTAKRRLPRKRDFWLCKLHSGSEWASA